MAGIGAAINTGNVGRGDSVAVFGCGGVGNAAIAGARLAGAHDDHRRRHRRPQARVGQGVRRDPHRATRRPTDPVEFIQSVTGGNGADVCIEAIGNPAVLQAGVRGPRPRRHRRARRRAPARHDALELPFIEVFGRGGALKSSWYGDCLPSRDFPMLIDLYLPGPPRPRPLRLRDDRTRRRRGGVPQDGARRGAALGRGALTDGDRARHHRRHLRPRRRRVGGHQQHLARRRRPRGAW